MPHLILLGDSIFDNAAYVPDRPPVVEQVRRALPGDWKTTLLAVDGHTIDDVASQLKKLPPDASHLFVSVGGNDALQSSWILNEPVHSVDEALRLMDDLRGQFAEKYRAMLNLLLATGKPTVVCTVYDQVPGLRPAERAALAGFNETILREAFAACMCVIDLRLICNQSSDYSHMSAIEPSATGGHKIATVIARIATSAVDDGRVSVVYA